MTDNTFNRLGNCHNKYQGQAKRVLAVCSAGLLRSPTVAWVLSNEPWNFNTRAAGIEDTFALIPVDEVLVEWADEIVCVEPSVARRFHEKFPEAHKPVTTLHIPDQFERRDPKLVKIITEQYEAVSNF